MQSILIVTNTLPGTGTTAGNAIEKIINPIKVFYEINFLVIGSTNYSPNEEYLPYRTFFTPGPLEDWSSVEPFSAVAEILSSIDAKRIAKRISTLIDAMSPEFVILDLQSHTVLRCMSHVNLDNSKSIIILWDHWSWRYQVFKSSINTIRRLDLMRTKFLKSATHVIVPSEEFKGHLIQEQLAYSEKISTIHLPVGKSGIEFLPGPAVRATNRVRVIGFAGQQYARDEFRDLLMAVRYFNQQPNQSYKIEVHLFGHDDSFADEEEVVLQGFVVPSMLSSRLSSCEVLFLPYPFDKAQQMVSGLSFPSKFTNYLEARRPVIFYGPRSSPLSKLLFERDYPFIVGSRSIGSLVHILQKTLDDFELQRKSEEIILSLIDSDFSSKALRKNLENAGFLSSSHHDIQQSQSRSKIAVWESIVVSNQLAKAVRPILPIFKKIRLAKEKISFSRFIMLALRKYKLYLDKKVRRNLELSELENLWKYGGLPGGEQNRKSE